MVLSPLGCLGRGQGPCRGVRRLSLELCHGLHTGPHTPLPPPTLSSPAPQCCRRGLSDKPELLLLLETLHGSLVPSGQNSDSSVGPTKHCPGSVPLTLLPLSLNHLLPCLNAAKPPNQNTSLFQPSATFLKLFPLPESCSLRGTQQTPIHSSKPCRSHLLPKAFLYHLLPP